MAEIEVDLRESVMTLNISINLRGCNGCRN
jgi:hypothetical protein